MEDEDEDEDGETERGEERRETERQRMEDGGWRVQGSSGWANDGEGCVGVDWEWIGSGWVVDGWWMCVEERPVGVSKRSLRLIGSLRPRSNVR